MATHGDLPHDIYHSIIAVLDYLWASELEDFEANPDDRHVAHALKRLAAFVGYDGDNSKG